MVNGEIALLLKLQTIDYDLGELERSKEYLPDMMGDLKEQITSAEARVEQAKIDLEQAKVRQGQLELEIKTKEAEMQKFQQQMMTIKTNKEYDAIVATIDNLKTAIGEMETELLETIETISTLEGSMDDLAREATEVAKANGEQLAVLETKIDSIGEKVSDREKARNEIIQSIPKRTFSTYERIRTGKGGKVIAPVRKRACGSCFKALTPKKIQEIKRGSSIITCDACGTLLYWDKEYSD